MTLNQVNQKPAIMAPLVCGPHSGAKLIRANCKYPRNATLVCIVSIIVSIFFSQFNCQTQHHSITSDCARHRHLVKQQPQPQQHEIFANQRQQRQFNQRVASLSAPVNQPQPQERSANDLEHEEFSLALGGSGVHQVSSNYTLLPQPPSATSGFDQQQQAVVNSTVASTTASNSPSTVNTTPAMPSDSIGSPVMIQPPVTTSSSLASPQSSSSPALTTSTSVVADPSAATAGIGTEQPLSGDQAPTDLPAVASTSTVATPVSPRVDESTGTTSVSPVSVTSGHQARQIAGGRMVGGLQPVSSSPSSISIITPLNGPPQQQQHRAHVTSVSASIGGSDGVSTSSESPHSAMMKPLFVVGNPISERDYQQAPATSIASSQYQTQQQQQPTLNDGSQATITNNKSPKVSETQIESHTPLQPASKSPGTVNSQHLGPSGRIDKSAEQAADMQAAAEMHQQHHHHHHNNQQQTHSATSNSTQQANYPDSDRMSGPPLVYSDGHLSTDQSTSAGNTPQQQHHQHQQQQQQQQQVSMAQQPNIPAVQPQQQASPRLFHGSQGTGAAVVGNNPRRPSLPPPVNQANAASGFRSPMSPSGPLIGSSSAPPSMMQSQQPPQLQPPVNGLSANFYQASPPYAGVSSASPLYSVGGGNSNNNNQMLGYNKQAFVLPQSPPASSQQMQHQMMSPHSLSSMSTSNQMSAAALPVPSTSSGSGYSGRRPLNITRVEHISAECSNDLIKAVIVFNGTFKGIIYSSGYVSDPSCLYVNGTGLLRYEFHIRLNQCGTLGSEKLHHPTIPGEARRRDQIMFNTLSIQYNSIIEQEWDEHYKVSCEYGSDFWKTVSFSPFNVETNTGSPVVFTINPPQCQMDVLLGHGMGPKIVDGPVTVGDPLTLLIHMKSEKAGYDILVKNCIAHNGSKQKMQLIDSNGCVVNERFISPFRGTYNDNDLRHVTLYAYLKAFRFTGSPVLYLECEIHMCQSACPPQMCYWRRLSKRSVDDFEYEYTTNSSSKQLDEEKPVISESLSLFKALQVRQEPEPSRSRQDRQLQQRSRDVFAEDDKSQLVCYRHAEVWIFLVTMASLLVLVITVAITCCLRIRKLSKGQFQHNRLGSSAAGSLSPSLLSISDAISSAGSIIGKASMLSSPAFANVTPNSSSNNNRHHLQQHQVPRLDHKQRPLLQSTATAGAWNNQQSQKQKCVYMQRQMAPSISPNSYQSPRANTCPTFQANR